MKKEKSLGSIVVVLVLVFALTSSTAHAAGSVYAADKNDVRGVLDTRRLVVSWTDTSLSMTIITYNPWKKKALLPDSNFIRAAFTGPEQDVKVYSVLIYAVKRNGVNRLVAPIIADGQQVGTARVGKTAPNRVRVSFTRSTVEGLGTTLLFSGDTFYKNRNKGCKKRCVDLSPDDGSWWQVDID